MTLNFRDSIIHFILIIRVASSKITTYLGLSDIKSSLTTNHTDIEIVPDRIKSNFDNIKKAHGQRGLSEK
jgi:hypothetical protein